MCDSNGKFSNDDFGCLFHHEKPNDSYCHFFSLPRSPILKYKLNKVSVGKDGFPCE